jgi:hypothetical protein
LILGAQAGIEPATHGPEDRCRRGSLPLAATMVADSSTPWSRVRLGIHTTLQVRRAGPRQPVVILSRTSSRSSPASCYPTPESCRSTARPLGVEHATHEPDPARTPSARPRQTRVSPVPSWSPRRPSASTSTASSPSWDRHPRGPPKRADGAGVPEHVSPSGGLPPRRRRHIRRRRQTTGDSHAPPIRRHRGGRDSRCRLSRLLPGNQPGGPGTPVRVPVRVGVHAHRRPTRPPP